MTLETRARAPGPGPGPGVRLAPADPPRATSSASARAAGDRGTETARAPPVPRGGPGRAGACPAPADRWRVQWSGQSATRTRPPRAGTSTSTRPPVPTTNVAPSAPGATSVRIVPGGKLVAMHAPPAPAGPQLTEVWSSAPLVGRAPGHEGAVGGAPRQALAGDRGGDAIGARGAEPPPTEVVGRVEIGQRGDRPRIGEGR